jgi:hypothetical protein
MNDEEADPPITCVLVYDPPMRFKASGLCSGRQLGTVETVHTPAVTLQKLTDHGLRGDALVLGQERPTVTESVLRPLIVPDILRIVGEVITNHVDDPAQLSQQRRCSPPEAPVREELRQRLG